MFKFALYVVILCIGLFISHQNVNAQDTLRVSLSEFISIGMENSGQAAFERGAVDLAINRKDFARSQRILPRIELSTQHGVIPGVVSDSTLPNGQSLPRGQYYLDPNLSNDWEDWAIFTRAELTALQPIFTWGGINNAIKAAESAAKSAEYEFQAKEAEIEIQLFELYYSYLLALEISRILDEANSQLNQVDNRLKEMLEDGDPDLKESDIFKFDIFKTEFEVQKVEVQQSLNYIERVWNYALRGQPGDVYMPNNDYLDPVPQELQSFDFYENQARTERPELLAVDSGIDALKSSIDATRSEYFPSLFLGISGRYANTPNRPRQTNPFIINNTNFASAAVGLTIRQNLNFGVQRNRVERAEIEHRRASNLKGAINDGIVLELNDRYRAAVIAESKVKQTENALNISREWVRHEQLNYDFGFGDVEDLTDAIQKELELRLELKQNVFELNKSIAALYKASGIPIAQLSLN